jgi:hypothetical protein
MVFQSSNTGAGAQLGREVRSGLPASTTTGTRELTEVKAPPASEWLEHSQHRAKVLMTPQPESVRAEFDVAAWFAIDSDQNERCIAECWYG